MAKTLLELIEQIKGILRAVNGGTGLSTSGTAGNVLTSDGAGGWISSPAPVQSNFIMDGGAAATTYLSTAKLDMGGAT